MSGKAYSIKEMKTIVDYLVEHKTYSEIKGRKMWMDFANSQLTNRTWQSLKETFLKRIMPDIHNPYYKLTIEQINSFRQGYDVAERNKNKLEIHAVSEESTSSSCNAENQKQTDTGNAKEDEKTAGEGIKCSKIPSRTRSSADTIILDNCYETTEDIQRDLESPVEEMKKKQTGIATKSLRDCITYSEPLTPMIQDVLDDFASEPEDEPQMVIVENTVSDTDKSEKSYHESKTSEKTKNTENNVATDVAENAKGLSSDVVEEVLLSEIKEFDNQTSKNMQLKNTDIPDTSNKQAENSNSNVNIDNKRDGTEKDTETESSEVTAIPTVDEIVNLITDDSNTKDNTSSSDKPNKTPEKATQDCSNSTADTLLPNNPEGLGKRISNETEKQNKDDESVINLSEDVPKTSTRKRSVSQDTAKRNENKKKKLADKNKITEIAESLTNQSVNDAKIDKEVNDNLKKSNKSPEKQQEINKLDSTEKPSTSKEIKDIPVTSESYKATAVIENPCLKNVSLFDEQFNNMKYDTSDTSEVDEITPNNLPTVDNQKVNDKEVSDVVMLKSHSDTESNENKSSRKDKPRLCGVAKKQREKALANVFGFSSGAVTSHRTRRLSRRKKSLSQSISHNHKKSDTSEWTSETDSDLYVSPPRARKNRSSKKYLKPESTRIHCLEEEGGLFVMHGKKIYPLVKDGKIIKNYLTYLPDSDSEEDESYWKQKYVVEKNKSDELKRLLQKAKEPRPRDTVSPILQPQPSRNSRASCNPNQQNSNNCGKELSVPGQFQKHEEANTYMPIEKIKIKFTKNDEEVHLEGHWPQIHPVLAQVVQIFHKESEQTKEHQYKMIVEVPETKTNSSRGSTPAILTAIDPEVHERVNEIEKEIFKEIEERAKEEKPTEIGVDTSVTKRKVGRPRKSSSSASVTPTKRPKRSSSASVTPTKRPKRSASKATDTTKPAAETENSATSIETTNRVSTRKNNNRTPRKVLNESINTNETKIQTRRSKTKLEKSEDGVNDDDDVRYMLPPNNKRQARSAANLRTKEQKPQKSIENVGKIFSVPSNFSLNSLDSTQGYQDSDISPAKTDIRKKKLINRYTYALRNKNEYHRNVRRRSHPYLYYEASNDATNSPARAPLKISAQNSSLNTEAYRSESYQLLMPQVRRSFRSLERIDETTIGKFDTARYFETTSNNLLTTGHINSDAGSSSNISLPQSPELSVVENISLSKDMLKCIEDHPTLNETQCNETSDIKCCNKYLISGVDVTMPLMQQDCGLESCNAGTVENSSSDPVNVVTESLLNKICTFNLSDQTPMTETLNQKLRNLLLESAKKVGSDIQDKENMMEIDDTNVEIRTKAGNKKRCSTPRKRKATKKSVAPKIARLVEEEHVESCSFGGRKSCPPVMQDYLYEDNAFDEQIANLSITSEATDKRKVKKKKDIIKVKIIRPKSKTAKEKSSISKNASKVSIYTDSGINDSGSGVFLPIYDSVDLIHNHSETCLLANECCGDSVEFIENAESVISLNTNSIQSNEWQSQSEFTDIENNIPECFCSNAQDMKSFYSESKMNDNEDTSDTVYHSPVGTEIYHNSLITEDLSDDAQPPPVRPSKWYLFSEEETTNSNVAINNSAATTVASFSSNLKQIFPVTYAVPNLSTITEKDNDDNSRKTTSETDGDTMDDLFAQCD